MAANNHSHASGPVACTEEALRTLRSSLSLTAAVLAIFDTRKPRPGGVLAAVGVEAARLIDWCEESAKDPAWKEARRSGASHERGGPFRGGQVLTLALPASLDRRSFWYLACARTEPFTPEDERVAAMHLRQAQVAMDHVAERGMGRLLVDDDDVLHHADPATELLLGQSEAGLAGLLGVLRPVIAQRWGSVKAGAVHDAILPLPDGPAWVRFTRQSALAGLPARLYAELRPVSAEDPTAVGVVADDRLAKALAFLTDQYRQGPSLEEVSAAVHISPFHFHRLFSKAAEMSPKHYLLRMQLMIAKWQLRATSRPISDIAAETGFASHGHFTATFHRMVEVSPTAYREREGG